VSAAHAHDHHHGHGAHGGHGGHGAHGGHGGHGGHGRGTARTPLLAAVVVTGGFMLVEVVVGFWSGSLALIADAGHMLADAAALGLALFAQTVASRPRNERSTYGYRRAEVLAAFVNGMALAIVAVLILKEAVERYFSPVPIQGGAMLATASAGLLVNLLVAAILMRSQRDSMNVRAAFAHVLSDALGSVAAILAGLGVVYGGWQRADPLVSLAIALLVALSGWRVLRETMGTLLEAAPPHLDVVAIERTILECPGVAGVHDLHVWRISERFDTLTAHVTLDRGSHGTDVCRSVAERLKTQYGLGHVTIQPEAPAPDELVSVRSSRDGKPIRDSLRRR
jgi:cobalt-zinc-cadmium efflux system protein